MSKDKDSTEFVNGHGIIRSTVIPDIPSLNQSSPSSVLTAHDLALIQKMFIDSLTQEQLNLSNKMVGWDRCEDLRETERKSNAIKFQEYDSKFEVVFGKLDKCVEVCNEFQATKGGVVTDAALARAEGRVMEKAEERAKESDGEAIRRVEKLEDKVEKLYNGLSWLFITGGVVNWFITNWKIILPIVLFLMAMFGIVFVPIDWHNRAIYWSGK